MFWLLSSQPARRNESERRTKIKDIPDNFLVTQN
jgi:hypothetical protein